MTPAEHEATIQVLFHAEAGEHFQAMRACLDSADADQGAAREHLQIALRAAHSLKGAARMAGYAALERAVHDWESCAAAVVKGQVPYDHEVSGALFRAVEAAEASVRSSDDEDRSPEPGERGELERLFGSVCVLTPAAPVAAVGPARKAQRAQGTTVRVATEKLDRQMASVEELLRLKVEAEERLTTLNDLVASVARLQAEAADTRRLLRQAERSGARVAVTTPDHVRLAAAVELQRKTADEAARAASALQLETRRATYALASLVDTLHGDIRAVRMFPIENALAPFGRMVREQGRSSGKRTELRVHGGETEVDRDVLEAIKDPIMHVLRNSVDHGIEPAEERRALGKSEEAVIRITARSRAGTLELQIQDDGRGVSLTRVADVAVARGLLTTEQLERLDPVAVRALIFSDGFSTAGSLSEVSGRGVGLAVTRAAVEKMGGRIELESTAGKGACFTLILPLNLATSRLLLVRVGTTLLGVPSSSVERVLRLERSALKPVDQGHACDLDGRPVQVFRLADPLSLTAEESESDTFVGMVLGGIAGRAVCLVDEVLREEELVARGLGDHLRAVPNVSGVAVLPDGRVAPILNASELVRIALTSAKAELPRSAAPIGKRALRRILVVDDSVTTRTLEKSILESAGYEVGVAVDGVEALDKLSRREFDLVLSDVQMPRIDGLSLVRAIKQDERWKRLPVVLVSSLDTEEQRREGLLAGADAYLSKGEFEQGLLLSTMARFL
jgi:two-component system chemotaxis sensor kinase CheA